MNLFPKKVSEIKSQLRNNKGAAGLDRKVALKLSYQD
jgi:hypothetical protein